MTTIADRLEDAAGQPVAGVTVSARLVATSGLLTGGGQIVQAASVATDDEGAWTLDLTPTGALAYPAGAYYIITGGGRQHAIAVPSSGGPYTLLDVLAEVPGSRDELGLTRSAGDALYVPLATVGLPGGAPGPLDDEGLVPADQLPAGQGGDGVTSVNGETGVVVLTAPEVGADVAGAAAAAVSTHTGLTDPHPQYLTPAEGNAAYDATGAAAAVATAAANALASHEADTTSVHGIPNTAALETSTGAAAKVAAHAAASDPHADRAYTDTAVSGRVPTSRQITAGTGLTGGGDLTADRTLTVAYGTSSTTAARGDDSRLSNARTPTAHASSHATGGGDAIAPADIGAARAVTYSTPLTGAAWTNATTTLNDVTGLALSIPGSGTYEFDFWVVWSGSVGGGTGTATAPRWQLTGPASTHLEYTVEMQTANATTNSFRRNVMSSPAAPTTGAQTADNPYMTRIRGRIVATASGTLQPQASLATGTATGIVSVLNGSYGRLQQTA